MLLAALNEAGHRVDECVASLGELGALSGDDIVVIQLDGYLDGVSEISEVERLARHARVIVLTPHELSDEDHRRLAASVQAIIPDDASLKTVTGAVGIVAEGFCLSRNPELGRQVPETTTIQPPAHAELLELQSLSDREITILRHLKNGRSNKDIARELGISDATVKVHLRTVFQKTHVKNRTQAAIWASRNL